MTFSLSAPAGRLAALGGIEGERAGQALRRKLESPEPIVLALAQDGRLGILGFTLHLVVILTQDSRSGTNKVPLQKWGGGAR